MIHAQHNRAFMAQNRMLTTPWRPTEMLVWLDGNRRYFQLGETNEIYQWSDRSGNHNHFQPLDVLPPYQTTFNGIGAGAVNLTGNIGLVCDHNLSLDYYTIFTVFQATTYGHLYHYSDNALSTTGFYLSTGPDAIATTVNGLSLASIHSYGWSLGTVNLGCHVYDGTHGGHKLYLNRASVALGTYGGFNLDPGPLQSTTRLCIGAKYDKSMCLSGQLAEFILYPRVLTSSEIDQVTAYLQHKYQLP